MMRRRAVPLGVALRALACRLLGPVRPGVVGQYSVEAVRIGVKVGLVDAANRWLSGSLFWPWWLRLAGMRVGIVHDYDERDRGLT